MLITPYNPDWIEDFRKIQLALDSALQGLDYGIEHVGSTSVPELAAKPIIDVDIVYESEAEFQKIKSGLLDIGYYHNGNQGIANREVFKRAGTHINETLDKVQHHLYVCLAGSAALNRHMLFRDHLRKSEAARLKYQAMKYKLAEKADQNKKRYAELKELHVNNFIDAIIEKELGK